MIITKESNPSDWIWLRKLFDKYFWETFHIARTENERYKKTVDMIENAGVTTLDATMDYNKREFLIIDMDRFIIAKMSR